MQKLNSILFQDYHQWLSSFCVSFSAACYERDDLRSISIAGSHQPSIDSCTKPPELGDFQSNRDTTYYPETLRDSGCETRNSTPCNFDPDVSPACEGSYFIQSGPYHNSGVSSDIMHGVGRLDDCICIMYTVSSMIRQIMLRNIWNWVKLFGNILIYK